MLPLPVVGDESARMLSDGSRASLALVLWWVVGWVVGVVVEGWGVAVEGWAAEC